MGKRRVSGFRSVLASCLKAREPPPLQLGAPLVAAANLCALACPPAKCSNRLFRKAFESFRLKDSRLRRTHGESRLAGGFRAFGSGSLHLRRLQESQHQRGAGRALSASRGWEGSRPPSADTPSPRTPSPSPGRLDHVSSSACRRLSQN